MGKRGGRRGRGGGVDLKLKKNWGGYDLGKGRRLPVPSIPVDEWQNR